MALAEEVGRAVARAGAVLICGGLGGVMEGAARGAAGAGGLTIGFLPGTDPGTPTPSFTVPLATGLGEGGTSSSPARPMPSSPSAANGAPSPRWPSPARSASPSSSSARPHRAPRTAHGRHRRGRRAPSPRPNGRRVTACAILVLCALVATTLPGDTVIPSPGSLVQPHRTAPPVGGAAAARRPLARPGQGPALRHVLRRHRLRVRRRPRRPRPGPAVAAAVHRHRRRPRQGDP
jgi:hypothetical protein